MNLREARIAEGMTQKELAEKLGIHVVTVALLETGQRDPLTTNLKQAKQLADIFRTDLNGIYKMLTSIEPNHKRGNPDFEKGKVCNYGRGRGKRIKPEDNNV